MKWQVLLLSAILAFAYGELPIAATCDTKICVAPSCRCSTTDIPGGLDAKDTPQFVLLTFDDGVNPDNVKTYRRLIYDRQNSNGCNAGATFFVSHEYTNYDLVNELYNKGFEIALHSISHRTPQIYWSNASYSDLMMEFGDQKTQMAHFANIPYEEMKGVRSPFLQMSGNAGFQVMADIGIQYDLSWETSSNNPGLWPYTLHYASTQECYQTSSCPTASIPGPWVIPMIEWEDLEGRLCSMVDDCYTVPPRTDGEAWFLFILTNFSRHYLSNRAPFGFYVHEWFVSTYPGVMEGLVRFLDFVNRMPDVFMVNAADVVDWVQDPIPAEKYAKEECRSFNQTTCAATSCSPMLSKHNNMLYWMNVCSECPAVYPWLGNPLGLNITEVPSNLPNSEKIELSK